MVAPDWVQSAVAFTIKCLKATIPECMLACGFSKEEAAVYRHLNKVGKPKQDDKNDEYVTPPTLAVDVPVFKESASSVTVSLSDIFVPGEEKDDPNDSILVGPPKRV